MNGPHTKLDAWHVARQLAVLGRRTAESLPRGYASLRDQLTRASQAPVLLIAEGANRRSRGSKRQRFEEAHGEAAEAAAAAELVLDFAVGDRASARQTLELADRVAAMCFRLETRFR